MLGKYYETVIAIFRTLTFDPIHNIILLQFGDYEKFSVYIIFLPISIHERIPIFRFF